MDIIIDCCAGLDVHQGTVVACVTGGRGDRGTRLRSKARLLTFATTPQGLAELVAWLVEEGVTHAAMEATGVYWMPVFEALEANGGIEPVVVNARHARNVPGRKTDVNDAEWLCRLVRHGLLKNSFIPDRPVRELRDLVRYRRSLVETQGSERQRLIKLLEAAGLKLAGLLSDVFGVSGRAILRALIEGAATAREMANMTKGIARKKSRQIEQVLAVRPEPHERMLLACQLRRVEQAETDIAALDAEIDRKLEPYARQMAELAKIPGVDRVVAITIISELGVDLSKFPTSAHLSAWAGVCPGNHQSAGKDKPTRARKGNVYLKTSLCNAAISASKKKGSYYSSKYHKLKARRGGGKAALAVAHKILVTVYHVLKGAAFRDLGENYTHPRNVQRVASKHVKHLEALGFTVKIEPLSENPGS